MQLQYTVSARILELKMFLRGTCFGSEISIDAECQMQKSYSFEKLCICVQGEAI